jgi:hypothetical protein
MLFNMSPGLSRNDHADVRSGHTMLLGQCVLGNTASSISRSNCADGIVCQRGFSHPFATRLLAFHHSIVGIFLWCAEEKMLRIHAPLIVSARAVMANKEPIRDWAIGKFIRQAMSKNTRRLSSLSQKRPITAVSNCASPKPTVVCPMLVHFSPKAIFKRDTFMERGTLHRLTKTTAKPRQWPRWTRRKRKKTIAALLTNPRYGTLLGHYNLQRCDDIPRAFAAPRGILLACIIPHLPHWSAL